MIGHEADQEFLYSLDDPLIFFPREWAETASKARYHGWRELHSVGYVDCPFDPRDVTVRARWAFRVKDDPFAELTHRTTKAPGAPGAYRVWLVEVEAC